MKEWDIVHPSFPIENVTQYCMKMIENRTSYSKSLKTCWKLASLKQWDYESHPIPQGFSCFLLKPNIKAVTQFCEVECWRTLMVECVTVFPPASTVSAGGKEPHFFPPSGDLYCIS